jgi:general secretion pathway protein A
MWFGEKHKEALATLKYGILDNKGFLLLTGDVGTGKTSLINSLIESLSDDIVFASVPDPSLEKMDFLNFIALAFGMEREFTTKGTFLIHFRHFLMEAHENHKKVLLIIDEAQLLTQEMLEEIRLLSNIERTDAKLINIFFVGQNEFNEILNQQQNRAVRQRLTLNYNIDPLTPDETGEYIKHRLKVAGTSQTIFNTAAVQEIFMYSGGFPRRINIICDHSLLSGYVQDKKEIDHLIVKECAKELKIPAHVRNRDINGFTPAYSRQAQEIKPQPLRPLPKQPKPKTPKSRSSMVWVLAFFSIFFLSWFFISPVHFKHSVSMANDRIHNLKDQIIQLMPNSFKNNESPLSPTPDKASEDLKPMPKKNNDQALTSQKTETNKIITKPTPTHLVKQDETATPGETVEPNETMKLEDPTHVQPIRERIQDENSSQVVYTAPRSNQTPTAPGITKIKPLLPKEKIILRFKYDTNDFSELGFENLKTFADILVMHPQSKILISGHTDSGGNMNYNQKLSEFRANIVRSFLLGKGATPDQIKIKGLGSKNPIEDNNTAWGRRMNRRVEIQVLE